MGLKFHTSKSKSPSFDYEKCTKDVSETKVPNGLIQTIHCFNARVIPSKRCIGRLSQRQVLCCKDPDATQSFKINPTRMFESQNLTLKNDKSQNSNVFWPSFCKSHNVSLRCFRPNNASKKQGIFQPQGADIESIGQWCDEDKAHMSWENQKKIGSVCWFLGSLGSYSYAPPMANQVYIISIWFLNLNVSVILEGILSQTISWRFGCYNFPR